jgi:predicted PurR-regulated permease PerM
VEHERKPRPEARNDEPDPELAKMAHAAPVSPPWQPGTKRIIQFILIALALLLLYRVRTLLLPIVISMIVAYALEPIVRMLEKEARFSRLLALSLVYLVIIGALIAIPVGTIPQIINQFRSFLDNLPDYLLAIGDFLSRPVMIGDIVIPLDELQLEQIYDTISSNLIEIIRSVGRPSFTLFGSVASITLSAFGWILVVLFISFYLVKDHRQLLRSAIGLVPPEHQGDLYRLAYELNRLWNDFFRARLILCVIVGFITFVIATIIELPNALALAVIAGIGEFIPNIGPTLASLPAMLVAVFQYDASWLGAATGPFWFALIILLLYILIQQVENTFLVPRIMGHSLNLHPMIVFIAALAGASVAGILGLLLAAPVLASARLVFIYIYRKLNDLPPFPDAPLTAQAQPEGTFAEDAPEPIRESSIGQES